MKSNIQNIIIVGVILLLLIAAVVILGLTREKPAEILPESPPSRLLFEKNPADLEFLTIKNETGEYQIERIGSQDDVLMVWLIGELISAPIDFNLTAQTIAKASTLTAVQIIDENAADLSIYGLTEPKATVKSEFSDPANTVKEILIGNVVPVSGTEKNYMSFKGENTVYAVNAEDISIFFEDLFYYVNRTVYTAFVPSNEDDTTDYTRINKLTISRKDIDYDIVVEYDKTSDTDAVTGNMSNHIMTSPVNMAISPEKMPDFMTSVFGLTAQSVEVVAPNETQKAEYGLIDPFADIYMDISGGDFHMLLGNENPDRTGRYALVEGKDVIYFFNYFSIPWATAMPLDITYSLITRNNIFDVNTIDIMGMGINAAFVLTGSSNDDLGITHNGGDVDTALFKSFYQFILKLTPEELYLTSETSPDLTIAIKADNNTDILEFSDIGNRRYSITLNGETIFTCQAAYIDRLIGNYNNLMNGEKIVENW